jgi:hypothetical protein
MNNTDLVGRYLNAVKLWLPRKQQTDILAEIAEDLHSQIEDRESALGRPLEEADLVAILKQRGSPMRVASGFIPEHRLINPAMLPLYRLVLKIVLLWVLAPIFAIVFIGPIFNSARPGPALLLFFSEAFRALFFVVGIVTTVFALLDRYHSKWVDKWDPRKLPRIPPAHQPMQWYNDFAGFAFGMAAFVFWAVVMWQRTAFVINAGFRIVLAPVWGQIYWVVLALTLARAGVDLYSFLRPVWTPLRSYVRSAIGAATILVALLLLRVGNWVDFAGPNVVAADVAKATRWVNLTMQITLISIAVITLIEVVRQLRLLARARNSRPAPIPTASFN